MDRLKQIIKNLEALKGAAMETIVAKAVAKKSKLLIELNQQQLDAGMDAEGNRITPEYAPSTVKSKKRKGQVFDRVTVKDKGNWRAAIDVRNQKSKVEIINTDPKNDKLEEKYGELLGVDEKGIEIVSHAILPDIQKGVKKFLKI